jgi:hypothetical protein
MRENMKSVSHHGRTKFQVNYIAKCERKKKNILTENNLRGWTF